MSNSCGYQLVLIDPNGEPTFDTEGNPIADGSIVELGVPRWGRTKGIVRQNIEHVTEKGYSWIYPQFDRRRLVIPFRILPTRALPSLEAFSTLDDAVGGNRDPFLFYENVDGSPFSAIFVRKTRDFDEGAEQPVSYQGSTFRVLDHTLELLEEPSGVEIL